MIEEQQPHTRPRSEKIVLKILTKGSIQLVLLDYGLRWGILIAFLLNYIGSILFIVLNIIFFIIIVMIAVERNNRLLIKLSYKVNPKYKESIDKNDLSTETSDRMRILYLITGCIATFAVFFHIGSFSGLGEYLILLGVTLLSLFTSYIFVETIGLNSGSPYLISYKVVREKPKRVAVDISQLFPDAIEISHEDMFKVVLPEDLTNDINIGRLETDLKSINDKVDAYMLESVLLGGLSFSAFVAIVSSSFGKDANVKFTAILDAVWPLKKLANFSGSGISKLYGTFALQENLFSLMMFECLICSVFFLLVLTLRLRFSNLSLTMERLVHILVSFNSKEEELINLQFSIPESNSSFLKSRLKCIGEKITETLLDANNLYKQIGPVIVIMSIFRNLGIIFFYIVLVTAGMYFSAGLSAFIAIIAICVLLFRWAESRLKFQKIKRILMRH